MNQTLSELTTADGGDSSGNGGGAERKREAARYLLANLERALQANQQHEHERAALEDRAAAAEGETERLRDALESALAASTATTNGGGGGGDGEKSGTRSGMTTTAGTLRAAKLLAARSVPPQMSAAAAAPLARRVEELEDLVSEYTEQASLQRVAELEAACEAHAVAAAEWERRHKRALDELEAARAAAPLDQGDIIEDLAASVRRKETDVQRLQTLLTAAHASHKASGGGGVDVVTNGGGGGGGYTLQAQPFNVSLDVGELENDEYFQ